MSAMPSFEDAANSLGQLVVQVSANAVRSNELAKSTKETYDTAMNYIQELRRAQKDLARSDYAELQVESQSGFLCYRCHKHCGSSARNCEVEIPDLEMSSILDLYTRIAHRGKKDERNEFERLSSPGGWEGSQTHARGIAAL